LLIDATPEQWIQKLFSGRLESPDEVMDAGAAAAELAAGPSLGSRPLVDLTHGIPISPSDVPQIPDPEGFWLGLQKAIARDSSSSILARADDADHGIPQENPQLVAGAIRTVVTAVRSSEPVPPCAQTPLPGLGATCLDPTAP